MLRMLIVAVALALAGGESSAQDLHGALFGSVHDEQDAVLAGARVRVTSPALIGGPVTLVTNDKGQLRFPVLAPGVYVLTVDLDGFSPFREEQILIGAGGSIERHVVLKVAGRAESVVVEGAGSHLDARNPGFSTRFGPDDLAAIPTRRASMFDVLRAAPGVSPTSPSSGTATTISAFGSGTNENQFLIDGTNTTCPCNGVARSEPAGDFIQEVQVQSVGASAEFGNLQGAVVNVVTRQGGERFTADSAYYFQSAALTSQPVTLPYLGAAGRRSGYERARYHDASANAGGPAVRDRLWFFAGYQHVDDADSQPGTDPDFPRAYRMDKVFGKLTWRLAPKWQLVQSFHDEIGINPDRPTIVTAYDATTSPHVSVPAFTFGNLTYTMSSTMVWDLRVGRFSHTRDEEPSTVTTTPSRFDRVTGVTTGQPPRVGRVAITRTTAKATLTSYRAFFGAEHQSKAGVQFERGEHDGISVTPGGVRYEDKGGVPLQSIASAPSHVGGLSQTSSAFVTDAVTLHDRVTVNVGVRYAHAQAISQDLTALDGSGNEIDAIVAGRGSLYSWNLLSPRLGLTTKLTADGRTILRASYGRFYQGLLTGEIESIHPGAAPLTMVSYVAATGGYTGPPRVVDPAVNLRYDPATRAPRNDEYSVGVDRAIGVRLSAAVANVHKTGDNFIGWTDVGGQYVPGTQTLADGTSVPVFRLNTAATSPADRRFLITNPGDYATRYDGVVFAVERRRASGWQAFGSYTFSRAEGLVASSGTSAGGAQTNSISPPQPLTFGRDPNDLTNARGRLANDRPHMLRVMGSADVPRLALVVAANLQYFSGKPWAASAQVTLPQEERRILLEPRGTRRLSSQTLLDLRVSRPVTIPRLGRVDVLLDVLNVLNDDAEESLTTETLMTETAFSPTFGQPASFVDPRRVMLGVRVNLGR
jgi:hypothetical protein